MATCRRIGVIAAAVGLLASGLAALPAFGGVFNPTTATLSNGLVVVVIENKRMPVVRQSLFYNVGSADDPPGKSGLAHYLEHLMFKGTKTVGPNEFSKIVARHGGRDNAFTSYDTTAYYQVVARDRLELVMKLEADRMGNLLIDPKEAIPELQVVLEERRARTDNRPAAQLAEQMAAVLYLHYPYRTPIIGWEHELERLTLADAKAFFGTYYTPNNAVLVIGGDVTMEEVLPLAKKYYGPIPRGPDVVRRQWLAEPPHRAARRVTLRSDRVYEPRWSREYLAPSRSTGEAHLADPLEVLDVILAGGATSRLYKKLVLEDKIALSIGTYYDSGMLGPSTFGFQARPKEGVPVGELEEAIDAEIEKLLVGGVTESEVETAEKRLLAAAVFARDSLRRGVNAIDMALTAGQSIQDVETWPERISKVTAERILEAARHVFREERSVTGLLLPETPSEKPVATGKDTVEPEAERPTYRETAQ